MAKAASKKAESKLPKLELWKVETLRLTAFHHLGTQGSDNDWWETTVGAQPESKTMKPRDGGYEVTGPFSNGILMLKADILRFDWLYSAAINVERPIAMLPSLGAFPEACDTFVTLVKKWLPIAPDLRRIAFGAVVLQDVTDRVAGYELADRYLHAVDIDPEGSSEFSYSINRARTVSEFDELRINRLSRWSVARFQPMTAMVVGGQQGPQTSTVFGDAVNAVRVELDINTDADRTIPLPKQHFTSMFVRLVQFGTEILEKGDIK